MADLIKKVQEKFVNQAIDCEIVSNIELSDEDKALLFQLNHFAVMQVEDDLEVLRDPRKVFYKSDEELKHALVGLGLAVALTKNFSRSKYNKEFFEDNIKIDRKKSGAKEISFGIVDEEVIFGILDESLIFDWMVYSDNKGRGIVGLADYKGVDLESDINFNRGGTSVYEFARFERKCYKELRSKTQHQKDDMQDAFRRVFAEAAAKQLAEHINPVEFAAKLFNSNDSAREIENMLKSLDKQSDNLKIEYKSKKK